MKTAARLLLALTMALYLTGCAGQPRSEEDAARDATSRPYAVLAFFDVGTGDTVLDLFAGNGYYSEVLADVVGANGQVYLHNNAAYLQFATKLDERLAENRLPNVTRLDREIDALGLAAGSLDAAILIMTYHDAYFTTDGWDVKPEPMLTALHEALKPGGVLGIVDHHAAADTGNTHAQDLHRIDVDFAIADITAYGFELQGRSDLLENPDDDLSQNVFDPAVRGQTSRFVLKFAKRER